MLCFLIQILTKSALRNHSVESAVINVDIDLRSFFFRKEENWLA